jgi:D-xylose transport system substrate-binding protein
LQTKKTAAAIAAVAAILAGCSSSATTAPATSAPTTAPTSAPTTAASTAPSAAASSAPSAAASGSAMTPGSFDSSFSAMALLKPITTSGSGLVGVVMPDTTSSTRWVNFDAPYLKQAFEAAGYSDSDFKIENAGGVDSVQLSMAQADITNGAKVLIIAPNSSTVGNQIQAYAAAHNVAMISYDRATFQGNSTFYVSFDNVQVGELIGKGFLQCVTDWGVTSPKVFTVDGGQDTDPNAIDFAKGYNDAVWGQKVAQVAAGATNSQGMTLVGEQLAPGWNNAKGGTIFQQAFTAHPEINATIEANDGIGNAVVTDLKTAGVPAKKIPTTGQDATLQGMENTLQNFQCGSVYKAIYLEAQDAVSIATFLRAGQQPPASLMNGTTTDPKNSATTEPASLLTPIWVNAANMEQTVIKDNFIKASDLCAAVGASVCQAAGIQ